MQSLLSRLISPFVAALLAWLASKGIDFGAEAETIINGVTLFVLAIFTALYGVIHKLIDRKVNPADDTKPIIVN